MAHGVSESLGGVFPNKVDATLEFRACRVTVVHPCRDEISIRIAVSTVTGRSVMYPDPPSTNYELLWI